MKNIIAHIVGGGGKTLTYLAFATFAAFSASAETWYIKRTDCRDALTNPAAWTNSSNQAATEFSATDSYVVKGEIRPMAGATFAGGPLYLGEYGSPENGRHLRISGKNSTVSFPNGLYLDYGICELRISDTGDSRLTAIHDCELQAGFITVRSPQGDNQFKFRCDTGTGPGEIFDNRRLFINAPMSSPSADEGIQIGSTLGTNFTVFVNGDCSGFLGRINLTRSKDRAAGGWDTRLGVGGITIGGEVRVTKFTAISAWTGVFKSPSAAGTPTECTIGTLNLGSNSVIVVEGNNTTPTNGIIHVRDSLSVAGPVFVRFNYDPRTANTNKVTILTAPASSTLSDADFTLGFKVAGMTSYSLAVENDGETKSLVATFEPTVRQVNNYENESTKEKAIDSFPEGYSSLTNAAAWSDTRTPHGGAHYVSSRNLRTLVNQSGDYDFPGLSFTKAGGQLTLFVKSFRVPKFITTGSPVIWTGAWTDSGIAAEVFEAASGTVDLGAYCGKTLAIDAEIVGAANLLIRGVNGTSSTKGSYVFTGLNTNFTGNITMSHWEHGSGKWTFSTYFQTLYVNDGRNLGGAKEAFDAKALTIKDMSRVSVTNGTVTLESGLNRGIFIDGLGAAAGNPGGRLFTAANCTLAVNWPIMLNGKLMKEGAGTLVLGGDARFIGGTPKASSNLFEVASGTLAIASHNAIDGMETTFDNGTTLKLKIDPANADLTKYGILNAKTDTPFTLGAGHGGKLPLALDTTAFPCMEEMSRTFGLVTVTNTAVAAVRAMMPTGKIRLYPGVHNTIVERANDGEGTVTFELQLDRLGMMLIYR